MPFLCKSNPLTLFARCFLVALLFFNLPAIADGPLIGVHVAETATEAHFAARIDAAGDLGIRVIRVPVDWNALEETQGQNDPGYVAEIKNRVAHAEANDQAVVMMLSQSPSWANAGVDSPVRARAAYPPTASHYVDYANAMQYLHSQLIDPGDDVQIDASTILAWEVWNEPNVVEFWPSLGVRSAEVFVLIDLQGARQYAALLAQTYDTMKSAYPSVTILGGSLASADTAYLEEMYDAWGGTRKFDHLSLHPYTRVDEDPGPNQGSAQYPDQCNESDDLAPPWCYQQGVENIRATMDEHGDGNKQIWFTEFGTASDNGYGGAGSEAAQREHMKRALDILSDWFVDNDAMKISVAITYRLEDGGADDLFGLYGPGLSPRKPVADEIQERLDSKGRLITGSVCDTAVTLQNDQWTTLSLPCEAPAGTDIADWFGDDITINGQPAVYGSDWRVFVYDPLLASPSKYVDPGADGRLLPGQGFWIIQMTDNDVTLRLPSGSQVFATDLAGDVRCVSPAGCVNLSLTGASNTGTIWHLLGNAFPAGVAMHDMRISTSSGPCSAGQGGCAPVDAAAANVLHDSFWRYNGVAYDPLTGGATVDEWVGFWAAELPAAVNNVPVLHVPLLGVR